MQAFVQQSISANWCVIVEVIKRKPPAAGIPKKKGTQNKITRAAKEAFQLAFDGIGGVPALVEWAKKNRKSFYTLYARLIPAEAPSSPLVSLNIPVGQPIANAAEAARIYAEILGDPSRDLSTITFASPAALPAPLQPSEEPTAQPIATEPVTVHAATSVAPVAPLKRRALPVPDNGVSIASEWERLAE